jgi:ribosomal protein S18 acetylase RimI-like enzyme
MSDTNSLPPVAKALDSDIPAIVGLLNRSYRGDSSRLGWTTEADLIGGNVRTDIEDVTRTLAREGSVFLVCRQSDGEPIGCVNLQRKGDRLYLGMFAVRPDLQGKGIGASLMKAAEVHALENGCHAVFMWVVSVRKELIEWYVRLGYRDTGERVAFHEDGLSGPHLRPLEFMVLEKPLQAV